MPSFILPEVPAQGPEYDYRWRNDRRARLRAAES